MSNSITLYLVRHGQTEYNATGRIQGWLDVPLDDIGHAQAVLVGKRFAGKKLAAVYQSVNARCDNCASDCKELFARFDSDFDSYFDSNSRCENG